MLPGLSLIGGTRLYHANVAPHLRQRKKRFLFEKCFCLKHVNNRCKGYVASSRLMQIVSKKGGKVFLRALADASRVQKKVERFFCEHSLIEVVSKKGGKVFLRAHSPWDACRKGGKVFLRAPSPTSIINVKKGGKVFLRAHSSMQIVSKKGGKVFLRAPSPT